MKFSPSIFVIFALFLSSVSRGGESLSTTPKNSSQEGVTASHLMMVGDSEVLENVEQEVAGIEKETLPPSLNLQRKGTLDTEELTVDSSPGNQMVSTDSYDSIGTDKGRIFSPSSLGGDPNLMISSPQKKVGNSSLQKITERAQDFSFKGPQEEARELLQKWTEELKKAEREHQGIQDCYLTVHNSAHGEEPILGLTSLIHEWKIDNVTFAKTAGYIQSLVNKAYQGSVCAQVTIKRFDAKLKENNNRLSAQEYEGYFVELRDSAPLEGVTEYSTVAEGEQTFIDNGIEKIDTTVYPRISDFLATKGIKVGKWMGDGSHGEVYEATVNGNATKYVVKKDKEEEPLDEEGISFWRLGDFAITRLPKIPHVAQTLFFIVRVTLPRQGGNMYFYLPANQAKSFGRALPSGSSVTVLAQLMERAPGQDLHEFMREGTALKPKSQDFKNIAIGVFKSLEEMHRHNIAYRDLKAENTLYDPVTKAVTLIDFGSAVRLRKREKVTGNHKNPLTTSALEGTLGYVSPRLLRGEAYGSEVDFFSYAMLLLKLINPQDFNKYQEMRCTIDDQGKFIREDHVFTGEDPHHYLGDYLGAINTEVKKGNDSIEIPFNSPWRDSDHKGSSATNYGKSKTATILEQNPEIAQIIDFAFQVSAGGATGERAFQQLQALPYFRVCP